MLEASCSCWKKRQPFAYLFIVGASGMLLGAIGKALVRLEEKRERSRANS